MNTLRFFPRAAAPLLILAASLSLTAPLALPAAAKVVHRKPAVRTAMRKRVATTGRVPLGKARLRTRAGVAVHTSAALRARTVRGLRVAPTRRTRRVFYNPWTEPTYADSLVGDSVEGDDPVVRQAATEALGPYNGTIVVTDPKNGRILSMVNQKLGLKGAYQPCSTVKVVVSFASLNEGIVGPDTPVRLSRRSSLDMTRALALSNNLYFAKMGESLGYDRFQRYAKEFGLGEKAGLDIAGEEPGFLATETPKSGMGMMTSFGDGIKLTPLELSSIVSTVANGGTMYYLQYPKTQDEIQHFVPRIKRQLEIARFIPQIRPGMMGAVEYGTARRAVFNENDPVLGKTGTCTDTDNPGVHLGWFGSFNDSSKSKVSVVVLLTGGRGVAGPVAAGIAGNVYRNLERLHYAGVDSGSVPTKLVSMQNAGSN